MGENHRLHEFFLEKERFPMFFLRLSWFVDRFCVPLQQKSSSKRNKRMATSVLNKIEYLVLLVAEFASPCKVTEA